jgi:hypothetical protein
MYRNVDTVSKFLENFLCYKIYPTLGGIKRSARNKLIFYSFSSHKYFLCYWRKTADFVGNDYIYESKIEKISKNCIFYGHRITKQ